ncbi:MAG: type IV secretion system protein [Succinivibrio sp.]|nr:type IV secretion system protein [Succinivibrio sp.]
MKKSQAQGLRELNLMGLFLRFNLLPITALLIGGALGFSGLAAYIYETQRSEYIPYLVTVDKQGAVLARDELNPVDSIPDRVVAWVLGDFTENLIARSADSALQEMRVRKVYALIKKDSLAFESATKYYNTHNPMDLSTQVKVDIQSIKRLTADSFDLTLSTSEDGGKETHRTSRRMIITYRINAGFHGDLEFMKLNPLNLQIESFSLSENNYG